MCVCVAGGGGGVGGRIYCIHRILTYCFQLYIKISNGMSGRMCGHESCNVRSPAVTYKTSNSDHA